MSIEAKNSVSLVRKKPGSEITVSEVNPFSGIIPGETALHEAEHIAPNPRNVRRATIRPGEGYLGLTQLYVFDAIQAAAPHANGRRGTGHDLGLIEAFGHDVNASISSAGQEIAPLRKRVVYIASLLQQNGEISGFDAEKVSNEAEDPKERIEYEGVNGKIIDFIVRRSQRQAVVHEILAA